MKLLHGRARSRIRGLLGSGLLFGACVIMVGLLPSPALVAAGAFGLFFILPILNGCSQAIFVQFGGYFYPRFRNVEDELPDAVEDAVLRNA